jgi:porphobilinogen synthase
MYYTRGSFPNLRMRRMRASSWLRKLTSEHLVSPSDLVWPLFVHDDTVSHEIPSMPGVQRLSMADLRKAVRRAAELGIPAVAIFPSIDPSKKDEFGSEALNEDNLVCRAVAEVKATAPEIGVICDVALDPFTSHGHDGLLRVEDGVVLNDETVAILSQQAVIQARAGCDIIAPSDMMDGRVGAVRKALDQNGFSSVSILSYGAKYASAFYGPFRDAIGSSKLSGLDEKLGFRDKRSYQINPANCAEALREVALDIDEGADMIMVKPGLPYLDVIRSVKQEFGVPTLAYQVSGEYLMLCAASERGYLNRTQAVLESLLCFKRAGADAVLTYFAAEVAEWVQ